MDPKDFLRVANDLAKSDEAAELRSAVSRAYYAAFHVARKLLVDMGFEISKGSGAHGDICNYLGNAGNPTVEHAGSNIGDLKGWRNQADYELDLDEHENSRSVQKIVSITEQIIKDLEQCCNGSDRDQIKGAISSYIIKMEGDTV